MKFKGKKVLITGAASGIGKSLAEEFANEGSILILSDRDSLKLKDFVKELKSNGVNAFGYEVDVSDYKNMVDFSNLVLKEHNYIDVLINNAGINPSRNDILNTTSTDWEDTINTNLKGAFLCSRQAIKSMKKHSQGSIVNISSVAAFGMQKRIAYSSSKAGIIGFTKSLARDYASKNIRVNCICPGYVPTDLVKIYLSKLSAKEKKDLYDRHPMGKLGSTEDIAFAVSFLLSKKAKWITGIVLNVDGGYGIF